MDSESSLVKPNTNPYMSNPNLNEDQGVALSNAES